MAQVTIYLEEELVRQMRLSAEHEGVSQSQWIARLIEARLAHTWPAPVRALAGAWADFPELEALRQGQGEDVPREAF